MSTYVIRQTTLVLLCASAALGAPAEGKRGREKSTPKQPTQNSTCNDVPAHAVDVILCRPTCDSVTLSTLAYGDLQASIAYGTRRGQLNLQSPVRRFNKGEPTEVTLGSLRPDTRYYFELRADGVGDTQGTFHTQRARGSEFTFTITADSHLDDRANAGLYQRTLANALADAPDFHIDLGDTFMTEKHDNRENAARQYLAQRFYFGQLCHSAPLFFVLGNHDGESPRGRGSEADSLAVWSNLMRKRYFPNPIPDSFFTGDSARHPEAGLLQDYFAWEWGDALFVVLDPYWFTQQQRGQKDNWKRSLGVHQYEWLQQTLAASRASFKFVFIHHLAGGSTPEGRGGAEAVPFFEWGGKNLDGSDGFGDHRPGWAAPIHPLLVRHHVSAVFHGHDHLYAKQDCDGIVYQEVPQPGTPGNKRVPTAAEYGYLSGVIHSSSGHVRVRISPDQANVDYVRSYLPDDERSDRRNAEVAHSYKISAPAKPAAGK
jgi:predicted phosphodiesterase